MARTRKIAALKALLTCCVKPENVQQERPLHFEIKWVTDDDYSVIVASSSKRERLVFLDAAHTVLQSENQLKIHLGHRMIWECYCCC